MDLSFPKIIGDIGEYFAIQQLQQDGYIVCRADQIDTIGHSLLEDQSYHIFDCDNFFNLAKICRNNFVCDVRSKKKPCEEKNSQFYCFNPNRDDDLAPKKDGLFSYYCSHMLTYAAVLDISSDLFNDNNQFLRHYLQMSCYLQNLYNYSETHSYKNMQHSEEFHSYWEGFPGRIDLFAYKNEQKFCLEVKTNTPQPSKWQVMRLQWMKDHGHNVGIVRVRFQIREMSKVVDLYKQNQFDTIIQELDPSYDIEDFDITHYPQYSVTLPHEKTLQEELNKGYHYIGIGWLRDQKDDDEGYSGRRVADIPFYWKTDLPDDDIVQIFEILKNCEGFLKVPGDDDFDDENSTETINIHYDATEFSYNDKICRVVIINKSVSIVCRSQEEWDIHDEQVRIKQKEEEEAYQKRKQEAEKHEQIENSCHSLYTQANQYVLDGQYDQAEDYYQQAIDFKLLHLDHKFLCEPVSGLLRLYFQTGNITRAILLLYKIKSSIDQSQTFNFREWSYTWASFGHNFERTGDIKNAETIYFEGLKAYPKYYYFFVRLFIMYERAERFNDAIAICKKAISLGVSDESKGGFEGRIKKINKKIKKKEKIARKYKKSEIP